MCSRSGDGSGQRTLQARVAASAVCLWILGPAPVLSPAAPGFGKLGLAFAFSMATWCWCFAVIGAAVRFMSQCEPRGEIRRGRVVLDLHHPPAGRRGAAGRSGTLALALEPQVSAHHGRHADGCSSPAIATWSAARSSARCSTAVGIRGTCWCWRRLSNLGLRTRRRTQADATARPAIGTIVAADRPAALATLSGVHKRYGKTVALAGLDLDVRRGELLALLGPNGAGKSTAISLWLGLLEPDAGRRAAVRPIAARRREPASGRRDDAGSRPDARAARA